MLQHDEETPDQPAGLTRLPSPVRERTGQKAADAIADHLRRDIAKGWLSDGERLPSETKLLEHFGVSRPTLREAYRILEAESLLRIERGVNGGPRVCLPSIDAASRYMGLILEVRKTTLADFFDVRAVIEPAAARIFAERQPEEGFAALEACIAETEQTDDYDRASLSELAFYQIVTEHCGNEIFSAIGSVLHRLLAGTTDFLLQEVFPDHHEDLQHTTWVLRDHRKLVRLLRAGDGPAAERFWRRHIERTLEVVLPPEVRSTPFDAFR